MNFPRIFLSGLFFGLRVLLGIAITEVILRITTSPCFVLIYDQQESHLTQGDRLYTITEQGNLRLAPHIYGEIKNHPLSKLNVKIRANAYGFRIPAEGPPLPDSNFNSPPILFLGDSITFEDYLPYEQTFVALTQSVVARSQLNVSTQNGAMTGAGLKDEIGILEQWKGKKPSLVILVWYLNDFLNNAAFSAFPPGPKYFPRLYLSQAFHRIWWLYSIREEQKGELSNPIPDLQEDDLLETFKNSHADNAFIEEVKQSKNDWGGAWTPGAQESTRKSMLQMIELTRKGETKLAVVLAPVKPQVVNQSPDRRPQDGLISILDQEKIPYLDLLPVLQADQRSGGAEIYFDHCHPNQRGNQIFAQEIGRKIPEWLAAP